MSVGESRGEQLGAGLKEARCAALLSIEGSRELALLASFLWCRLCGVTGSWCQLHWSPLLLTSTHSQGRRSVLGGARTMLISVGLNLNVRVHPILWNS